MSLDYFTLEELRALPDLEDVLKYPSAVLTSSGEWVQAVIEREVGTSFVPRSRTQTLDGNSQDCFGGLSLATPYVIAFTAITSNGVAFDAGDLAEVSARAGIAYRRPAGEYTSFTPWDAGFRNIVITYTSGYTSVPPADIKGAALQGARDRVLRSAGWSGTSDRATSITNDLGNIQMSVPGEDRPTGLPEVDAVIIGWRDRLKLYGFG